jgi:hypothetical protein
MPVDQEVQTLTHLDLKGKTFKAIPGTAKMPVDSHTLWEYFHPIALDYMTCTEMSVNGAMIAI